jgi:hypothetical protein
MTETTAAHAAPEEPTATSDAPSGSAAHADAPEEIEYVDIYPEAGKEAETAKALLDAADDPRDVRSSSEGYFRVPSALADKAEAALPAGYEAEPEGGTDSPPGTDDNADGTVDEIEAMTNDELRTALGDAGQPTSGNKAEMQARLREYRAAQAAPAQ